MRMVVLLTEHDPSEWDRATESERRSVLDGHRAFDRALREGGATVVAGDALAGPAHHTRVRRGRVVTDGPFAETVEHLTGFYVLDAPDVATVVELAGLLTWDYTLEIRPVIEVEKASPE